MYQSILVPLDGSHFSEHALPIAGELARRAGATLRLVHIHTLSASPIYEGGQPVIDENFGPVWASDGNGLARELGQCACADIFFPDLNELATCGGGQADGFDLQSPGFFVADLRTAAEGLAVGDQIEQRLMMRKAQRRFLSSPSYGWDEQGVRPAWQVCERFRGI